MSPAPATVHARRVGETRRAPWRVWMFTLVLATAATGMIWRLRDEGIVLGRASLPWWAVAAL